MGLFGPFSALFYFAGHLPIPAVFRLAWLAGRDAAEILGYSRTADPIRAHVDPDDKGVGELETPGGPQVMVIINESGLYSLIFGSKLPKAKEFKHWVTSEVLPSIRKNGGYIAGQETMTDSELIASIQSKKGIVSR